MTTISRIADSPLKAIKADKSKKVDHKPSANSSIELLNNVIT